MFRRQPCGVLKRISLYVTPNLLIFSLKKCSAEQETKEVSNNKENFGSKRDLDRRLELWIGH